MKRNSRLSFVLILGVFLLGGFMVCSDLSRADGVADIVSPRFQSITYFDDNRNGKTDRLVISADEVLTGTLNLPYSTGMTVYTRRWWLVSSGATSNHDFSDHIASVAFSGSDLILGLTEGDMIRPSLRINTNAGSSASDLKFGLYTNATVTDITGNVATLATSKFPNSSTGIVNGMQGIDVLDTGYLSGALFSGMLSIDAIDSRGNNGSLVLHGVDLSVASDSHIGDGNVLTIGTGSRLSGNSISLYLGNESRIDTATGVAIASKSGFSASFRTASGTILSDVSTVSEESVTYAWNGTLVGSWLILSVDYVFDSGSVESVYSGALLSDTITIPLSHGFSLGHLRARIEGFSDSLSGVSIVYDELSSPSVAFTASIVSTGSVSDVTWNSAKISGVQFLPNMTGSVRYGAGDLDHSGAVVSGVFDFIGLSPATTYFYRLGFVPFASWSEVVSDAFSFTTSSAPRSPPSVSFAFQSTTYLIDQNSDLSEFTCDTTHTDCKVNFNLTPSFSGITDSEEFFCEIDFDLDLESGEEYKCNPNTVTFPRGHDYHVRFRIINSLDVSLISERSIAIHSPALSSEISSTGSLAASGSESSTGTSDLSGVTSETGTTVTLPDRIVFDFQQWSYVTDPDASRDEFSCDTTHADCKINFDLSPTFTGSLDESDYSCSSDFGGVGITETGKCNPASITFPRGSDYTIRFRIVLRDDSSRLVERTIVLHAPVIPIASSGDGWGGGSYPTYAISDPEIRIQSGLDSDRRCFRSDCAVNLEYKPVSSREACRWEFSWWAYAVGTDRKCNPGYVHYPFGNYTIRLVVYEQGNEGNFREKTLAFSNGTPEEIALAASEKSNHPPIANIKLQGTLGKNKKQSGDRVTCLDTDECGINLSGEESYDLDWDRLWYEWDFGNGAASDRENPAAIAFSRGTHTVRLRVTDSQGLFAEASFVVEVFGKWADEPPVSIDPNVSYLRLTGVSPNPYGADGVSEWVEIENPLPLEVSLGGCMLDDAAEKWSDPYHFTETTGLKSASKKRFYKLQTRLNFNNTGDVVRLVCGDRTVSSLSWDYSVPEGFVVTGEDGPYAGRIRTKILRTVDGDTVVAEVYGREEKIRLVGVDTPETVDPRKSVQFFGREASDFTKKSLAEKEVELEFNWDPRDKYDRLLAYVWIDGKNFSAELVRLGYARAYLRFPFKYSKEFETLEKEAKKTKLGLWADAEVKKVLEAETKEDKQALEDLLKQEDKVIFDDLIEVYDDPKIAAASLVDEFLSDFLADIEGVSSDVVGNIAAKKKSVVARAFDISEVRIVLQWIFSRNREMTDDGAFLCRTKKTCSVNLTASGGDRSWAYRWTIDGNTELYGYNPKSYTFGIGSHRIDLRVFDAISWAIVDRVFSIRVERLVTAKKTKKSKKPKTEKASTSKARTVREVSADSNDPIVWLTPFQASASGVGLTVLAGGSVWILRRRWPGIIA